MHISLNWIRDYLDWNESTDVLVDTLTRAGVKVERVEERGANFDKVVVVQILESTQHPNADRLSVCRVDDGSGTPRQIVCGAKNYRVGDKVPAALPGAVLPGDFRIKVGKLRGVESEGMMCSGRELGLSEDSQGLLILPAETPVGAPIGTVFPADTLIELEITPNRPDWLSHIGVARELAVFQGGTLRVPASAEPALREDSSVATIEATSACSFYTVRRVEGVRVAPSPGWMKSRLEAVGFRSINNIVDITNYVMMETGQPLHAFDADKVRGGMVVRYALPEEKLVALNGQTLTLKADDLVIADESGPIALAGVMGGASTEVTDATTRILLESACFASVGIRRTGRSVGLSSESSYRFERGVSSQGAIEAGERAVQFLAELAGGSAVDGGVVAGRTDSAAPSVTLRDGRVASLLGVALPADRIDAILSRVGCRLEERSGETSRWASPYFRFDLLREVDLIEELARVHGIENIPSRLTAAPAAVSAADKAYDFARGVRERLVGAGFFEARTSTLVGPTAAARGVSLRNPMGGEQSVLRPALLGGLLEAMERNLRHGASAVRLFEVGRVFRNTGTEEQTSVAFVVTGIVSEPNWRGDGNRVLDLFDVKSVVAALLPVEVVLESVASEEYPLALEIRVGSRVIGIAGQLAPSEASRLQARNAVAFAELDVAACQEVSGEAFAKFSIPRFPSIVRDLAIVVDRNVAWGAIDAELRAAQIEFLAAVKLFDVFTDPTGQRLPTERKSLAFSLTFRSPEKTLEAAEANKGFDRIKSVLRERFAADFRE